MYISRRGWQRTFPGMFNSKRFYNLARHLGFHMHWTEIVFYYDSWKMHKHDSLFESNMNELLMKNITATEINEKMNSFVCTNTCPPASYAEQYYDEPQQKGNNPMSTNAIATTLNIAGAKSDDMIQRECLINEFNREFDTWRDPMSSKLAKTFDLDAPTFPKTAEALIDAIKTGKYTLDTKYLDKKRAQYDELLADGDIDQDNYPTFEDWMEDYGSSKRAITFTDLPKADRKGYDAAMKQWAAAKADAKTKLMILPPTEGLDLLLSLRNWTPSGKSN